MRQISLYLKRDERKERVEKIQVGFIMRGEREDRCRKSTGTGRLGELWRGREKDRDRQRERAREEESNTCFGGLQITCTGQSFCASCGRNRNPGFLEQSPCWTFSPFLLLILNLQSDCCPHFFEGVSEAATGEVT